MNGRGCHELSRRNLPPEEKCPGAVYFEVTCPPDTLLRGVSYFLTVQLLVCVDKDCAICARTSA